MNFKHEACEVVRLIEVAQIRAKYRAVDNTVNFLNDRAFLE